MSRNRLKERLERAGLWPECRRELERLEAEGLSRGMAFDQLAPEWQRRLEEREKEEEAETEAELRRDLAPPPDAPSPPAKSPPKKKRRKRRIDPREEVEWVYDNLAAKDESQWTGKPPSPATPEMLRLVQDDTMLRREFLKAFVFKGLPTEDDVNEQLRKQGSDKSIDQLITRLIRASQPEKPDDAVLQGRAEDVAG